MSTIQARPPIGRPREESGAVLVAALIFIGVWSIVVFAILAFAEVGFGWGAESGRQTGAVYASEGAVEVALAYLAADPDNSCDDLPFTFNLNEDLTVERDDDGQIVARDVQVTCEQFLLPTDLRLVDLEARIGPPGTAFEERIPRLQVRVELDDATSPSEVDVRNWTVLP